MNKYDLENYNIYQNNPNVLKELKDFENKTKWMSSSIMLLADNRVEYNCKETNCNINFQNKNGEYIALVENTIRNPFAYGMTYNEKISGVFIHTDCYKYVEKEYNISLKYGDLPIINTRKGESENIPFDFDYGEIQKYWGQFIDFNQIFLDKKDYLCSSPLSNDINLKQIKKNISNLKLKGPDRVGPSVSATFYKSGDIKMGNNKKLWIIKNNKWTEINEPLIEVKIKPKRKGYDKNMDEFSFMAQYNKNGIFVKDINMEKNGLIYTLITLESNLEKLSKIATIL